MALSQTPTKLQNMSYNTATNANPIYSPAVGNQLKSAGTQIGNLFSKGVTALKGLAQQPIQNTIPGANKNVTFTPSGLPVANPTQNMSYATPASPAATSPTVNTVIKSPAAQQYVQSKVDNSTPSVTAGLYNGSTGLTQNGLTPQQVGQGYSTIPGSFDPVTGKPVNGNITNTTNTATGTTATNSSSATNATNTVQIDPNTGQPLNQSPTDKAYQTYLDSLNNTGALTNSEKALNDFQLAEKNQQTNIGNQAIPMGFITGQQQVAAQNNAAQEANLQGNISIAQQQYQNQQQAAQAGLDYQYNQQQLNKPIQVSPGSQLINPITGEVISGSATGTNGLALTPQTTQFLSEVSNSGVNLDSLVPSFGNGAAGSLAKQQIFNNIAKNASALGIDGATFGAMLTDSRAKTATYTALQKQGSQTKVNEDTAIKNFNQLEDLSQKVANDPTLIQSSIPVLQKWLLNGQLALTGNPNVNNFMGTLTTALTEYAKVVSGATTGAAVTDSANGAAQQLLNAGLSPAAISSFVANATKEMANRTSSYDDALKGLFGNIKDLGDTSGGLGTSTSSSSGSNGLYDF